MSLNFSRAMRVDRILMEKNGPSFDEWTRNHVWFRAQYQRLARNYDRQNIAFYQGRVVDQGDGETLLARTKITRAENIGRSKEDNLTRDTPDLP
jgi:hypothetical protein